MWKYGTAEGVKIGDYIRVSRGLYPDGRSVFFETMGTVAKVKVNRVTVTITYLEIEHTERLDRTHIVQIDGKNNTMPFYPPDPSLPDDGWHFDNICRVEIGDAIRVVTSTLPMTTRELGTVVNIDLRGEFVLIDTDTHTALKFQRSDHVQILNRGDLPQQTETDD